MSGSCTGARPRRAVLAVSAGALLLGCAGAPLRPAPVPAPVSAPLSAPGPAAAAVEPAAPREPVEPGEPAPALAEPPEPAALAALRAAVVEAAAARAGKRFRGDCSAYVLAALRAAGVRPRLAPARSRSESLHDASERVEVPRPGDLAFFHDTHDRNRDGRRNDRFTHVALVEAVDGSAITLLHRGGRGVERVRMDLSRPSDPAANDPVRVRRRGERAGGPTLAGELFAAFGALLPAEFTQMLQASPASVTDAGDPAPR